MCGAESILQDCYQGFASWKVIAQAPQVHNINFSKQPGNAGNEANVMVVELHVTVGVHCNVHVMHIC